MRYLLDGYEYMESVASQVLTSIGLHLFIVCVIYFNRGLLIILK